MALDWEFPGAEDPISEQKNVLSLFYGIQWVPLISFTNLSLNQMMAICGHDGKEIFHSNNLNPIPSL